MSNSPHDLPFDVLAEHSDDKQQLRVSFDVAASPADVWAALTDAEKLMSWFPLQSKVEPGPGGQIWLSWDGHFDGALRILEWEPERRLRTTWPVVETATEDSPSVETDLEWTIEANSGGTTTVRMVHSGFPTGETWDELFESHRRGWTYELQSLRHYLGHHKGCARRIARVRRQVEDLQARDIWDRLFSSDGLFESGAVPMERGGSYRVVLRSGHHLEGRVLIADPPTDLGATVSSIDGIEGTTSSLLRVSVESWAGPGTPLEVHLWLATWGVELDDVLAVQESWTHMVDSILEPSVVT